MVICDHANYCDNGSCKHKVPHKKLNGCLKSWCYYIDKEQVECVEYVDDLTITIKTNNGASVTFINSAEQVLCAKVPIEHKVTLNDVPITIKIGGDNACDRDF